MNTAPDKWHQFDTLALEASKAWDAYSDFNTSVNRRLGNTITTPGMTYRIISRRELND